MTRGEMIDIDFTKRFFTMKSVLSFLFVLSVMSLNAQLYSYDNGGSVGWSTTDPDVTAPVDCSCSPGQNDDLIITSEIAVSLGAWNLGQGGSATISVRDGATLNFTGDLDIQNGSGITILSGGMLNATNVVVSGGTPGGTLTVSSGGAMSVSGDFTNNNNSDGVTIDGSLSVTGDLNNGNGSDIVGSGGITVGGTVDNSGTIGGSTGNNLGTLPVDLLYFQASEGNQPVLNWATATEINNDYFAIERSEDGNHFYEIGRVVGHGDSNQEISYSYTDVFPLADVTYYQLVQYDYDGQFERFNILRVETEAASSQQQMRAYPTIVEDRQLNIASSQPFQIQSISLYSLGGSESFHLLEKSIQNDAFNYAVDLSEMANGLYLLKVATSEGNEMSTRILVK